MRAKLRRPWNSQSFDRHEPGGALRGAATGRAAPRTLPRSKSAGRALFLADADLIHVADRAADVHEVAPPALIELAAPVSMGRKAGARRNQPADDDVFLQAAQIILQAANRRLGQHAGGLLER